MAALEANSGSSPKDTFTAGYTFPGHKRGSPLVSKLLALMASFEKKLKTGSASVVRARRHLLSKT
jgi:hypothetical protein